MTLRNSWGGLISFCVVLYLFLYNPLLKPGIGFGTFFILFSCAYTILKFEIFKTYIKLYRFEFGISLFALVYVFIICTYSGEEIQSIVRSLFLWIMFSTVVPFSFVEAFFSKFKNVAFWEIIIEVGFVAAVISCLALFYPPFNEFLKYIQVDVNLDSSVASFEEQLGFRSFGFAHLLVSSYGFTQGIMASLCLIFVDQRHKRYAFYFMPMVISVIINARTGLVPIALTLSYVVLSTFLRLKLVKLVKYLFEGVLAVLLLFQILKSFPDVIDFVQDFMDQLYSMFIEEGFEDTAYSRMMFYPETTTGLIFGEGHVAYSDTMEGSDIEYVNQIFLGGLIFAGALLLYEIKIYFKIMKMSKEKVLPTIFFLSILVFCFKGASFYDKAAFAHIWMLYFFVLVHNKLKPNNQIKLI